MTRIVWGLEMMEADWGREKEEDQPSGPTTEGGGEPVTRRHFLDLVVGGSVVATAGVSGLIALTFLRAPEAAAQARTVDMGPISGLEPGAGQLVSVGTTSVIVVRPGEEEAVVAFSAVCTHLGCLVAWDPERAQIACPCHGALFDLKGNVVGGPAPRPLAAYPVSVQAGEIIVGSA